MRRKDRELSKEEAFQILERGEYGTLSMIDPKGRAYAVPITYTLFHDDIILHSSTAVGWRKSALLANPEVCFSVVVDTKVLPERFGTLYWSAIARGKVTLITDPEEKRLALEAFLPKYSADYIAEGKRYIDAAIDSVDVWKLSIKELTGKARKK